MGPMHAIYENGVFKPKEPVSLPEHCEVMVEPRVVASQPPCAVAPNTNSDPDALERALAWVENLKNRTDEEIEEVRHRLAAHSPVPRPIPEGKTLEDMVVGTWPGDETDEQIREALERLS